MNRPTTLVFLALTAACGSSGDRFDAKAPEIPFVDQYRPAGADPTYDGTENCGPAVLAGIAKAHGETDGLQDATLIMLLADVAGTDGAGTTGWGMIAALEWLGLEHAESPGADLDWIDGELAAGHDVIANGDYYAVPGREHPGLHSGHYIAISGVRDDWSVYDVTDPAGRSVHSMTDGQLENFIESHPMGGFTISTW